MKITNKFFFFRTGVASSTPTAFFFDLDLKIPMVTFRIWKLHTMFVWRGKYG